MGAFFSDGIFGRRMFSCVKLLGMCVELVVFECCTTVIFCVQLMSSQPEKPFIKNKAAQVFSLTFIMEYLTAWPKFFFDLLSLVGLNPHGLDIYLRTLMAIDAEVVDRDILHTPEVRPSHRSWWIFCFVSKLVFINSVYKSICNTVCTSHAFCSSGDTQEHTD